MEMFEAKSFFYFESPQKHSNEWAGIKLNCCHQGPCGLQFLKEHVAFTALFAECSYTTFK